jgi:hypothetical protein
MQYEGVTPVFAASLLAIISLGATPIAANQGTIEGLVVNGSRDQVPCAGAEVVLRVEIEGRLVAVDETRTDAQGRFRFEQLPVADDIVYLPGANRDAVHYPGSRVRLTNDQPHVQVRLAVFDSVSQPNPLVVRDHEVVVRPEPGLLRVTETVVVNNPSMTCYVGQAAKADAEPVTLRLAIPADFERATFQKEFFGRRFSWRDDALVTGIPWPPGSRRLQLTYVIANNRSRRVWERTLDLPCSRIRLTLHAEDANKVSCNLPPQRITASEQVFESGGETLPAGHVIRLELGHLPVQAGRYVRWVAVVVLLCLMVGASLLVLRRRGGTNRAAVRRPSQHKVPSRNRAESSCCP